MKLSKLILFFLFFFLNACSAAYEQVKNIDTTNPESFYDHLLYNYKTKASFEAIEMHDWNSAKLYSEKALQAFNGKKIYPEKIESWNIPNEKLNDIDSSYNNLLSIYEEALIKDPENLAKAISSLDCWAEQEEEKWQLWDIEKCKTKFYSTMHIIYNNISIKNDENKVLKEKLTTNKNNKNISIITKDENNEVMQIIYFDFDDYSLSNVSKNTLMNFLNTNIKNLSRFIIIGHSDSKGSNDYNYKLSLERALAVKKILLNRGISEKYITVMGKGESELATKTPDDTKHPANRRAEVKILN